MKEEEVADSDRGEVTEGEAEDCRRRRWVRLEKEEEEAKDEGGVEGTAGEGEEEATGGGRLSAEVKGEEYAEGAWEEGRDAAAEWYSGGWSSSYRERDCVCVLSLAAPLCLSSSPTSSLTSSPR